MKIIICKVVESHNMIYGIYIGSNTSDKLKSCVKKKKGKSSLCLSEYVMYY
jgi:hypothetical protein